MLLILLSIVCAFGYSLERIHKPNDTDVFPSDEYYRLTKVLGPVDFYDFDMDFHVEIARYNFSESEYSDVCFDAYVALKFTPKEVDVVRIEMSDIVHFVKWNNITERFFEQLENIAPWTRRYLILRRKMIEKLSVNARPDTRKFVHESLKILTDGFLALLKLEGYYVDQKLGADYQAKIPNMFMANFVELLTENRTAAENTIQAAIKEVAVKYRALPTETKRDLERSLCIRNVLNWINSDVNGLFNGLFNSFTDEVGLNMQALLKDNNYLCNLPLDQVKEKFKNRAEKHYLSVQIYVDNCAKMFSVMKLNEEELDAFNRSTDYFMGKKWGRVEYSSSDDLLNVLIKENAPLIKIISKRWNFLLSYPTTPVAREFLSFEDGRIADAFLKENNRQARSGEKSKLNSSFFLNHDWYNKRSLEQYFCIHSTFESIVERELTFSKMKLMFNST